MVVVVVVEVVVLVDFVVVGDDSLLLEPSEEEYESTIVSEGPAEASSSSGGRDSKDSQSTTIPSNRTTSPGNTRCPAVPISPGSPLSPSEGGLEIRGWTVTRPAAMRASAWRRECVRPRTLLSRIPPANNESLSREGDSSPETALHLRLVKEEDEQEKKGKALVGEERKGILPRVLAPAAAGEVHPRLDFVFHSGPRMDGLAADKFGKAHATGAVLALFPVPV